MEPRDTHPDVDRALVPLPDDSAPGETGVRYRLAYGPRPLLLTVPATGEIWVTVGCRRIRVTPAEAREIATDLTLAADAAEPEEAASG